MEKELRIHEFYERHSVLQIDIPTCGQTVCDNPQIITNYQKNWQFHAKKNLRYRFVVLNDDNGRYNSYSYVLYISNIESSNYKI